MERYRLHLWPPSLPTKRIAKMRNKLQRQETGERRQWHHPTYRHQQVQVLAPTRDEDLVSVMTQGQQ
jgi:hypothetical protein